MYGIYTARNQESSTFSTIGVKGRRDVGRRQSVTSHNVPEQTMYLMDVSEMDLPRMHNVYFLLLLELGFFEF